MMAKLGILAFGSLIDHPGWEIEEAMHRTQERHPHAVQGRVCAQEQKASWGSDSCTD